MKSKKKKADLVARLRLQPEDAGGPSRVEMLREREEAAREIEHLREEVSRLCRSVCDHRDEIRYLREHGAECRCINCRIPGR